MAEIIAFANSTPAIIIEGSEQHGYFVKVRPCPDGIPSLKEFWKLRLALDYAALLNKRHGWQVNVRCNGAR